MEGKLCGYSAIVDDLPSDLQEELRDLETGENIDIFNFIQRLPFHIGIRESLEKYSPETLDKKPDGAINYSDLRRSQTLREFYATIDDVAKKLDLMEVLAGFGKEKQEHRVRRLPVMQNGSREEQDAMRAESREIDSRLQPVMLQMYFLLRIKGYNKYPDLT